MEAHVSEKLVRDNLEILAQIKKSAALIPGSKEVLAVVDKIENAVLAELEMVLEQGEGKTSQEH